MLGYKGFKSNMKCVRKQYEVGKSYHENEAILCKKGMHFCLDPLDVFTYYSPNYNSKYCLVEVDNISYEKSIDDTKKVCKDLTIIKEFTRGEYIKEICKYHNSKDGIVKKDYFLYILSDNNIYNVEQTCIYVYIFSNNSIYNIKQKYGCLRIYGNNNIIINTEYSNDIYEHGKNNIIVGGD